MMDRSTVTWLLTVTILLLGLIGLACSGGGSNGASPDDMPSLTEIPTKSADGLGQDIEAYFAAVEPVFAAKNQRFEKLPMKSHDCGSGPYESFGSPPLGEAAAIYASASTSLSEIEAPPDVEEIHERLIAAYSAAADAWSTRTRRDEFLDKSCRGDVAPFLRVFKEACDDLQVAADQSVFSVDLGCGAAASEDESRTSGSTRTENGIVFIFEEFDCSRLLFGVESPETELVAVSWTINGPVAAIYPRSKSFRPRAGEDNLYYDQMLAGGAPGDTYSITIDVETSGGDRASVTESRVC